MKTVPIYEVNALKAYNMADKNGKKILEDLFTKEFFFREITDRVKTIDDVFALVPPTEDQKILLNYRGNDRGMIGARACLLLEMIAKSLNEGWKPDWTNSNEYKYYPYFRYESGFGFSGTDYDYWYSGTTVGSRLCFKSRKLAEYAGTQFKDIYNEFLNQ